MRHGLHLSKLSRTTSHRMLMLRNLVSSLLKHQQVSTTLAKAKAAQRLADQVIGWGKNGGKDNWERANAFLLNSKETLDPLFGTYARRYENRPGGYTRILRSGYRVGDNAPLAVLELVDHQHDLRFENSARTCARELAIRTRTANLGPEAFAKWRARVEAQGPDGVIDHFKQDDDAKHPELNKVTRKNVVKSLQFRPSPSSSAASSDEPVSHASTLFLDRVHHHYLSSLAEFSLASSSSTTSPSSDSSSSPSASALYRPDPSRQVSQLTQRLHPSETKTSPKPVLTVPMTGKRFLAGERTDGYIVDQPADGRLLGAISRAKGDWSKHGLDRKRRVVGTTEGGDKTIDELEKEFQQRL
ncbi:hypothetical protein JCM3766R1_002126 [Sporobolomyces carnicolor]